MELPDFLKYKDNYSNEGFTDKISRIAKRERRLTHCSIISQRISSSLWMKVM